MTTVALPRPATEATSVGFGNVLHSEFTKLRTVRSLCWSAAIAVTATLVVAAVMGVRWANVLATDSPAKRAGFDAANTVLSGIYLAQVIVGAIGVLAVTSEWGTGLIRATFAAVPQRRTLLAAKAVVLAGVTLVAGEIVSFAAFGIGDAFLSGKHFGVSLGDPGVLRAVCGGGLYLTAIVLLGFGIGAALRNTAAGLSTFFGVLFAVNALIELLPTNLRNDVINYLPANAGSQIFTAVPTQDALSPWAGFGVLSLYAAVATAVGLVLVNRRDA
jgi:hypothetical protein